MTENETIKALKRLIRNIERSPLPKEGTIIIKKDYSDIISFKEIYSNDIEELIDILRIFINYKNLDIEALKRENRFLKKLIQK